jgi:hypothetical protein
VTSCIVDSAAIYIMAAKFRNTIWVGGWRVVGRATLLLSSFLFKSSLLEWLGCVKLSKVGSIFVKYMNEMIPKRSTKCEQIGIHRRLHHIQITYRYIK